jgi:RHS repeat-associated protein
VNTLAMTARHPSGQFTTNATSIFTNSIGTVTVTNNYDANGNVIARVQRSSGGQLLRTETLTWDAFNRLSKETLRDAFTNGYDCVNVYDAFGRRLRCTFTAISSNAVQNTRVVQFWYDPDFEFMQLGFSINGKRHWRIHGPDLNGTYAGLQGIGGLEAIVEEQSHVATALITDFFGNIVATNTYGLTASAQFLPVRYSAYGPLEGYQPPALSLNAPVATAFGWLGKAIEPTGKYEFGTRQYEPTERRFISYDTIGFAGGNYPWGYCNGNPIYHYDPDGRLATAQADRLGEWLGEKYGDAIGTYDALVNPHTRGQALLNMSMGQARGAANWTFETAGGINQLLTGGQLSGALNTFAIDMAHNFASQTLNNFDTRVAADPNSSEYRFGHFQSQAGLNIASLLVGTGEANAAVRSEQMLIQAERVVARGGGNVLLDSSVIPGLRQSQNLGGRILPGENPLVSYVSGPEMRNAAAHNPRYFVPKALDDLPVLNIQPSLDLRINIRGQLPAGPGRFGDGIIGAQALENQLPLITNDRNLRTVIESMGGTVR